MNATLELFEDWKKARGFTTDSAAGHALGVTRQTVNNWRSRGGNAEAHVIERMANDLGKDPIPYILRAFSEASKSAEAGRSLARMAKKLAASGLALLLAVMPFLAPTADAVNVLGNSRDIHYAQRIVRIILGAIARLWPSLRVRPPRLQPHDMEPVTCNRRALCPSSP